MWTSTFLNLLPFSVNVSGKKHDFITAIGRILSKDPKGFHSGKLGFISTKNHPKASIIAYAGWNFKRSFTSSDLGQLMKTMLEPGDLFYDVGANLGGYSWVARELGATCHLVEASPELARFLVDNETFFGDVHPFAASDRLATLTFYESDTNIGGNSLVMSQDGWEASGYSRKTEVVAKKLDDILPIPDRKCLLKIDVEGHEAAAVRGADELLASKQIFAIWCEVRGPSSDRNPNSYQEVVALLQAKGYLPYLISSGKKVAFSPHVDQELPQFFDLLFLPE